MVSLSPGEYYVKEVNFLSPPPEQCSNFGIFDSGREAPELGSNILICANFIGDCTDTISEGQIGLQCNIENTIVQAPELIVQKEWFVCNNDDIDCTVPAQGPGQQISFEGPFSGNYTLCASAQDCSFANDAGFDIEITGNSPTPATFSALVNTNQDIFIGAGPFAVSEQLFSEEFVPNANFQVQNVPVGDIGNGFFGFNSPIIAFDEIGQRVFTANQNSDSVSIIDLANANTVTNVPLLPSGGNDPFAIAFDATGQRVFTANFQSSSVSIIDLANGNTVTNVPLAPSGGSLPIAIAFDATGQRVFTANFNSDSVSIIDLANANTVTNVPLAPSGGSSPTAIAFDATGQRVFTANAGNTSLSIIDLANSNTVTNVPLVPSGALSPIAIAFDATGLRVFTANQASNSVSIIDLPTVAKICQDSGFDTGDIRTFVSGQQTLEQITCVNFVGECTGDIEEGGETKECTVQDYAVKVDATSNGIDILSESSQQEQLTEINNTKDIMTKSILDNEEQESLPNLNPKIVSSSPFSLSIPTNSDMDSINSHVEAKDTK